MKFLNVDVLNAMDRAKFAEGKSYPFINPQGVLTQEGYGALINETPDIKNFTASFGIERKYGQRPHDRYVYGSWKEKNVDIPDAWRAFLREIKGVTYQRFLRRMFNTSWFETRFSWHYTPAGASVSPHVDGLSKLGSHIFYLNDEDEWDSAWGGQTVVCVDRQNKHLPDSNPEFEDFDELVRVETTPNYSFLFERTDRSWHGVESLRCPEGVYRKVFVLVFEITSPTEKLRRVIKGRPDRDY